MYAYAKYGPFVCITVVIAIVFILWLFWGGKKYEFVGLGPLNPNTMESYTGSVYNWGNNEIDTFVDGIEDNERVCIAETTEIQNITNETNTQPLGTGGTQGAQGAQGAHETNNIDNTPKIPITFTNPTICPKEIDGSPISKNLKRNGRFFSKGERICKETMERIYGVEFINTRPEWLRNTETGYKLELDCYNDDLKLAVEYNGEQHYKWPNFTNQSYQQFIDQVRRDKFKVKLCDRNGVYLIVVPYNVNHDMIPSYIISHLPETLRKRLEEEKTLNDIVIQ